jgi:hypothetical protein
LAQRSVNAAAAEIHILFESIERTTRLFARDHQELLYDLSQHPDDEDIIGQIQHLLTQHFPKHYKQPKKDQVIEVDRN